VATALSLTRPDLKVIVEMGDGDGYGLGMGHFVHTLRRNVDLTCIAHNNQIYGLTTGQASPTTEHLMRTVSTPGGVLEEPVNPIGLALAEGATFVARGFAGDIPHLTELYKAAIEHDGFALVDVFQPCVTWNKLNTFSWFRERVYKLEDEGHDAVGPLRGIRAVDDDVPRDDVHTRGVPRPDRHLLPRRRRAHLQPMIRASIGIFSAWSPSG
jgi:2-oxoglutarate/2-oxoacid ferredoxin oxidoreductase subunit beta